MYGGVSAPKVHESHSPKDVFKLFDELGYTMENWKKGIRVVPRVYLSDIPKRWQKNAQKLPVKKKKEIFFRLLAPLILRSNELIMAERKQLETLAKKKTLSTKDTQWLKGMAKKYKLKARDENTLLTQLLIRVDIVPVSLALAQGAEESGWGTSRFAILGNSLFGQWDFSGKGIAPKQQRKELGNYGLARFKHPQDAVNAYALNLNTHRAYKSLRQKRATLRQAGQSLSGYDLAKTLTKYSERGQGYVDTLHQIMRVNKLRPTDEAYLWDKGDILLTPVGASVK